MNSQQLFIVVAVHVLKLTTVSFAQEAFNFDTEPVGSFENGYVVSSGMIDLTRSTPGVHGGFLFVLDPLEVEHG